MKQIILLCFLAFYINALSDCARVPVASLEKSLMEDKLAKQMEPRPDKAIIYIYRNEIFEGSMAITVDGYLTGEHPYKTYFLVEVDPGDHVLISYGQPTSRLILYTKPGKKYYVRHEVKKQNFSQPGLLLRQVSEEEGRFALEECTLNNNLFVRLKSKP